MIRGIKVLLAFIVFSISALAYEDDSTVMYNEVNLSDSEKIEAITNYLVDEKLNIPKPKLVKKPQQPYVKPASNLIKGRFETTKDFQKRIQKAKDVRENYLSSLEENYAKEVLIYNAKVSKSINAYNKKLQVVKDNINKIKTDAIQVAFGVVYGKPILTNTDYDADNEIYYGKITSSINNFEKNIAVPLKINDAKNIYDKLEKVTPKLTFYFSDNQIAIKKIELPYKNKSYNALLTDENINLAPIIVKADTRALNLKTFNSISTNLDFEAQAFDIGSIAYSKSKMPRLTSNDIEKLYEQRVAFVNEEIETLESLLQQAPKKKVNKKAFAIIFGIENYLLESDVTFSRNSALSFALYARNLLGIAEENIWLFVGNKTTAGYIKSQWKDFLSLIENDSTVYFYFSGHGVPSSNGDAYLLPKDTDAETISQDNTFMLENLYKQLSDSQASKIVAFVDSCFSGKDENGKLLYTGVAPALIVKNTDFDDSKMTIFTAGSNKDFSNQYIEKRQRLFSYFLMKGMAKGLFDIQKLYAYVKKNVAAKSRKIGMSYQQIPQLHGKSIGSIR